MVEADQRQLVLGGERREELHQRHVCAGRLRGARHASARVDQEQDACRLLLRRVEEHQRLQSPVFEHPELFAPQIAHDAPAAVDRRGSEHHALASHTELRDLSRWEGAAEECRREDRGEHQAHSDLSKARIMPARRESCDGPHRVPCRTVLIRGDADTKRRFHCVQPA